MADDQFSLSIDTDWKKQAQEEKRKLSEEQQQKAEAAAAAPAKTPEKAGAGPRGRRGELPAVSFGTLVQSLLTQALFYLGELARDGGEPNVDLDRAKHHVDTLSLLEEKTVNNLTPEEQHMLDAALYEARTRYVNVASQYI